MFEKSVVTQTWPMIMWMQERIIKKLVYNEMNEPVIIMDTDIMMRNTANDTFENVTIDIEECYVNDTNCLDLEADSIEPYFYK